MHLEEATKIDFATQILLLTDKKGGLAPLMQIAENFGFSRVVEIKPDEVISAVNESPIPTVLVVDYPDFKEAVEPIIRSIQISCSLISVAMIACVKKQYVSLVGPCLNAGYLDYAVAPVVADDMACRLIFARERLFREHMYHKTAERDPLTSVLARQSFLDRARVLYASAVREQISVALVMVSIDNLEEIGQTYGQSSRENILISFAEILRYRKRDTDLICRYDEKTFCLMTVNMRESHLDTYLDDLALACLSPEHTIDHAKLDVNASIGVTVRLGHHLDDMLKQCTLAVDKARAKGKNQVSRYGETLETVPLAGGAIH